MFSDKCSQLFYIACGVKAIRTAMSRMLYKVCIQLEAVPLGCGHNLMSVSDGDELITRCMNQQNWHMSRLPDSFCRVFESFEASHRTGNKRMPKTETKDYIARSDNGPRYDREHVACPLKKRLP